jgi:membrane protein YqaA with SNARE-associated domain
METWLAPVLHWLAWPGNGLAALFAIAFLSATLVPLGSEPALLALLHVHPDLFWRAIAVATAGNTLGGALTWATGRYAHRAYAHFAHRPALEDRHPRLAAALRRYGSAVCLLSWLPVVGDPLCAVAGWLRLPFWPCAAFMGAGKCARYLAVAGLFRWASGAWS